MPGTGSPGSSGSGGSTGTTTTPPPPPSQRTLTVTPPGGTGSGSITGTGINCPGDCTGTYADGTAVTLSANPAAGSPFAGWSGACSGTGSCQLTMNANKTVSGSFTAAGPGPGTHDTVIDELGPGQENQVYEDFHGVWQSQSGTFVCQVDAQPEQSCNTPVGPDFPTWHTIKYNGLAPGDHTFKVTAIEAGVRDPSPATRVLNIPVTPSYTLTTGVTGSGTITGASINCPGTCSHSYASGTQVTLSPSCRPRATPSPAGAGPAPAPPAPAP